jgi:HK97 family phage prohead protease
MNVKQGRGAVTFKQNAVGEYTGEFQAVFSTLGVVDHDGDVTMPGAFTDGQKVRISYWGHRWQDLPVGRGEIHADEERAWVDGQFFLDTEAGKQTFLTVKNLGELQEWSYGFDILERSEGDLDGDKVWFLKRLDVHEVSPVMLGAGIDTGTVTIKSLRAALLGDTREATIQELHDLLIDLGAKCGSHGASKAAAEASPDDSGAGGDGTDGDQGAGDSPSSQGSGPSTMAARLAMELIEEGFLEDGYVV